MEDGKGSLQSASKACGSALNEPEACTATPTPAGNGANGRERREPFETQETVDLVTRSAPPLSLVTPPPLDEGPEAIVGLTASLSPSCPNTNSKPSNALHSDTATSFKDSPCEEVHVRTRPKNSPLVNGSTPLGSSRLKTENSTKQRKKRGRKHDSNSNMTMEHSGLSLDDAQTNRQTKRMRCAPIRNGALQCLKLEGIDKDSDESDVSKELARCLQETKSLLIGHVVRVLGVERSLELIAETADIQENGGTPTADGKNKRTPGGVFLTLVKNCASSEEKKEIFKQDKALVAKKKREIARHKREERMRMRGETQQKAEWTLQTFRMQLAPDVNMEKRLFETSSTKPSATESFQGDGEGKRRRRLEEGEGEMEVDGGACKAAASSALNLEEERKLAEEFESTNSNFELGFQFEID